MSARSFFWPFRVAQIVKFLLDDIAILNKRLWWQITNKFRRLRYIKLDQDTLKLVVFTNSSFANNKDMSLQIGYVIYLANATNKPNVIYWSSIKCKRVTHSVLVAKLYRIMHGFDIRAVIKATPRKILRSAILLVLCTNSKSLYECLVNWGTIQKKQLMVNVMSLRQSYKEREIIKVKSIYGHYNQADFITKTKSL